MPLQLPRVLTQIQRGLEAEFGGRFRAVAGTVGVQALDTLDLIPTNPSAATVKLLGWDEASLTIRVPHLLIVEPTIDFASETDAVRWAVDEISAIARHGVLRVRLKLGLGASLGWGNIVAEPTSTRRYVNSKRYTVSRVSEKW